MSGEEDRHWRQLQREQAANRPRRGEDRAGANDSPLLHPANEGHDDERARERLEEWAAEEGGRGPDARRLRKLEEAERGPMPTAKAEEPEPHGGNLRGGEPKKHPKPPEATTPEAGRGPSPGTAPGAPPAVTFGSDGEPRYTHGVGPRSRKG